eukprot:TRINITY_DN11057_c0_g1_i1.p1 TRINITY_DN11057_c0_g1~~TRINITY_DN11057_c0_g1_i1.p1  ORF type:complete len:681 (+),score=149.71 TRINITY_DN11057_c0_g1_i1:87-2129(+)
MIASLRTAQGTVSALASAGGFNVADAYGGDGDIGTTATVLKFAAISVVAPEPEAEAKPPRAGGDAEAAQHVALATSEHSGVEADEARPLPGPGHSGSWGKESSREQRRRTVSFDPLPPQTRVLTPPQTPPPGGKLRRARQTDRARATALYQSYVADQLYEALRALMLHPTATQLLEAPEVCAKGGNASEEVLDLKTIGTRLVVGMYIVDKVLDPELFWEDVRRCWRSVKRFYSGSDDVLDMADNFRLLAEAAEADFWVELAGKRELAWSALLEAWRRDRLRLCLQVLSEEADAKLFLMPFPHEELELADYLEVVKNPVDLGSIGDKLRDGAYLDRDGFDAELFWEDIARCWGNCFHYFEHACGCKHAWDLVSWSGSLLRTGLGQASAMLSQMQAYQMAERMQAVSSELEESFWSDLKSLQIRRGDVMVDIDRFSICLSVKQRPGSSIEEDSDSSELSEESVKPGATVYAMRATTIFKATNSWTGVGELQTGTRVVTLGAPELVDGYPMVSIMPSGAVDLRCLSAQPPKELERRAKEASKAAAAAPLDVAHCARDRLLPTTSSDMLEDRLIHDWCQKQLRICLRTLLQTCEAAALPREARGLEAIGRSLGAGEYVGDDGLVHPDLFWSDVRRCWRWEATDDETARSAKAGGAAYELEKKFWMALERFESSIASTEELLSAT